MADVSSKLVSALLCSATLRRVGKTCLKSDKQTAQISLATGELLRTVGLSNCMSGPRTAYGKSELRIQDMISAWIIWCNLDFYVHAMYRT